ncbi:hypothetical protein HMPREF1548_03190 [Clostridium sp. KLE 1755]|nr:hypothetical protein HMPREF1548_03190 [Clostridium sp. KLE 1755]
MKNIFCHKSILPLGKRTVLTGNNSDNRTVALTILFSLYLPAFVL